MLKFVLSQLVFCKRCIIGEPVLCGFARSFGLRIGDERREWVKPIMFSGGIGSIHDDHLYKRTPEVGKLSNFYLLFLHVCVPFL